MARYGSPDVGFLFVDGIDLLPSEVHDLTVPDPEAITEESHGLGKSWVQHMATGVKRAQAALEGLYDDATDGINAALADQQQTQRILCIGFTSSSGAIGSKFLGAAGAFFAKYGRMFRRAGLTRARADITITGAVEDGVVLQDAVQKSAAFNTEAAAVDHGTATANGGGAYLHVKAMAGFTGFVGKVRHSADNVTFADLVTFDNVAAAPAGQRKAVTGTVNRYLAFDGAPVGAGTITVMAGFARG